MGIEHDEIDAIIDYVEAHPEEWDQSVWALRFGCGTVACIAGHAAIRAGYRPYYRSYCPTRRDTDWCTRADGKVLTIYNAASLVLGLSAWQADRLFTASNNLDDLRRVAKEFRVEEEQAQAVFLDWTPEWAAERAERRRAIARLAEEDLAAWLARTGPEPAGTPTPGSGADT